MTKKSLKETASYNKLVQSEGDFDNVPDSFYSTQSGYPSPENPSLTEEEGGDEEMELPMEVPPESPPEADLEDEEDMGEESVDMIQNEIIRYNIETLKSIHSEIQNLNSMIDGLNTRFDELDRDVEEVREPTNVEKLERQKDVSYPYYFNLNDFWKGNWFEEHYGGGNQEGGSEEEKVGSIRKLPDGSFVADFDDLPKDSFIDIEKSFHDVV